MKKVALGIIIILLGCLQVAARAEETMSWEDCIKEAAQNNHPAKIDNWAMPGGQQKIRAKLNLLIKAMEGVKSST